LLLALEPMTDKKPHSHPDAGAAPQPSGTSAPSGGAHDPAPAEAGALLEAPEAAVLRLEGQLADLNERYLRLAAEYDNYRKRTARERSELWTKAQVELLGRLVDGLEDLGRLAQVDAAATDPQRIQQGVELVERKVRKELEAVGVSRIDPVGAAFDPRFHEAVTTGPAAEPSQDHTVGAVLQTGYRLGDTLIRPARVQVLTWSGSPTGMRDA